ncbi:hypothetical protein SDC9_35349 [bioreactor metagenome]|uniref:Archaeal Type IV pilin N-terminal domain-containing protein n=1 Tax=bioreactor metagenome TaxID=1076179 RepID=A0A644VDU1_9ZZZZ|nr:hypothetical protein [Methanocorpusculum sp.]
MALKYRRKVNQKEKRLVMIGILSMLILIIVLVCIFSAVFGMEYMINKSLADPDVLVHVTIRGDDVIVTIDEGCRVDELLMLSVQIEGVQLSNSVCTMNVSDVGTGEVVFNGACAGVTGERDIAVRGIFSDGKTEILKLYTVKFTET